MPSGSTPECANSSALTSAPSFIRRRSRVTRDARSSAWLRLIDPSRPCFDVDYCCVLYREKVGPTDRSEAEGSAGKYLKFCTWRFTGLPRPTCEPPRPQDREPGLQTGPHPQSARKYLLSVHSSRPQF